MRRGSKLRTWFGHTSNISSLSCACHCDWINKKKHLKHKRQMQFDAVHRSYRFKWEEMKSKWAVKWFLNIIGIEFANTNFNWLKSEIKIFYGIKINRTMCIKWFIFYMPNAAITVWKLRKYYFTFCSADRSTYIFFCVKESTNENVTCK